jgi:trans-aconitate 2-methyltransferase
MPTWNPAQYLKFDDERTRPCRDLVARIRLPAPRRVIDLGCGPGNSTQVLAERWPDADVTGLDSSEEMLRRASEKYPHQKWELGEIDQWTPPQPYDLVFSNAAYQWVPDHARVMPHLLQQVIPGGVLAFQVPANLDAPAHESMRRVAASPAWQPYFPEKIREWHAHQAAFYCDALAGASSHLDIWTTEYLHILEGPEAIVEWYKGTGLRPFLDRLSEETIREKFLADYLREIEIAFPRQSDGRVLFPFLRLFVIATRKD